MKTKIEKQQIELDKQLVRLREAIDLITGRIDGHMRDEKELARANDLIVKVYDTLRK